MHWDVVEGNWKQFKGHVKETWGKLSDDNLDTIVGKRYQLVGTVQETYGITKNQAESQVKAFEERHKDCQPKMSAPVVRPVTRAATPGEPAACVRLSSRIPSGLQHRAIRLAACAAYQSTRRETPYVRHRTDIIWLRA